MIRKDWLIFWALAVLSLGLCVLTVAVLPKGGVINV